MYASINGEIIAAEDAKILITDLSIQRGYGIFDFFRVADNHPLFLEDHLDRFYRSATGMHLVPAIGREGIKELVDQLIQKNDLPHAGIKITLTGGYSEDGYLMGNTPNLLITQGAIAPVSDENFNAGVHLVSFEHQRQFPEVKTIDYLKAIYLQPFIKANNAGDALYYYNHEITECPRSNFFIVDHTGELITPSTNILNGITRKRILGFPDLNCKEGTVTLKDVREAREAFVTSTTRIVLPVLSLDGKPVGNGKPGAVTRVVYDKLVHQQGQVLPQNYNQPEIIPGMLQKPVYQE